MKSHELLIYVASVSGAKWDNFLRQPSIDITPLGPQTRSAPQDVCKAKLLRAGVLIVRAYVA